MGDKSSVKVFFLGEASSLARASRQARGDLDSVGKKARNTGSAFSGLGKRLAGAAAAVGAVRMFKSFITEAEESRRVGRLTEQVIKSTGGAARISARQVGELATAISNKTGVDDEAIQSGANLLLTFTNVQNKVGKGNDIFNRATQAITDMSAALGQDTKASAIQLGKALNDPIRGITALRKVGVSFTDQQQKQIKTLVKSGKTLDAQKIILAELGREFGGAAAATASPSQKLGVIFDNLKEKIGTGLLPAVDKTAKFLGTTLIPAVSRGVDVLQVKLAPAFAAVERTAGQVATGVRVFFDAFRGKSELNEFDGKLRAVNNAGIAFRDAFNSVARFMRANVLPVLRMLGGWIKDQLLPALGKAWATVLPKVREAFDSVGNTIKTHHETFVKLGNVLRAVGVIITEAVIPILGKVAALLWSTVGPAFKALVWFFDHVWIPVVRTVASVFLDVVGAIVNGAAKAFGWVPGIGPKLKGAAAAFNKFRDDVNKALSGIKDHTVKIAVVATGHKVDVNSLAGQQRFASGTNSAGKGLALVGEEGPELVEMAGGERVHTAAQTRRLLSGAASVGTPGGGSGGRGGGGGVLGVLVVRHEAPDGRLIRTELLRLKRENGVSLGLA